MDSKTVNKVAKKLNKLEEIIVISGLDEEELKDKYRVVNYVKT